MKKILFSIIFFCAIAGFGGIIAQAHAETLTPAQAAALKQSLDGLKTQLLQLQARAASQTPQPTQETASGATVSSANKTLTSLTTALVSLQSAIAKNPQTATKDAVHITVILGGVKTSLVSMKATLGTGPAASAQNETAKEPAAATQPATVTVAPVPVAAASPDALTAPKAGENASPDIGNAAATPADDETATLVTSGAIASHKGLIAAIITFFVVAAMAWYLRQDNDAPLAAKTAVGPEVKDAPWVAPITNANRPQVATEHPASAPPLLAASASRNIPPHIARTNPQQNERHTPQMPMEPKRKPA